MKSWRGTTLTKSVLQLRSNSTANDPYGEGDRVEMCDRHRTEGIRERDGHENDSTSEVARDHPASPASASIDPYAGVQREEQMPKPARSGKHAHLEWRSLDHDRCNQREGKQRELISEDRDRLPRPEVSEVGLSM